MLTDNFTTNPSTCLQLTVSAKNLKNTDVFSKSDPICSLFVLEGRLTGRPEWKEKCRTEKITNSLHPEWNTRLSINYFFEERQQLRFDIYDIDSNSIHLPDHDFLGRFECDLAEIVSAPGGVLTGNLKGADGKSIHRGTINISAEEIDEGTKENVQFFMEGKGLDKKDLFGKSDPFLNIYRIQEDGRRQLAHRTEYIKRTLNPQWKVFEVNCRLLCGGDKDKPFLIECFDHDSDGGHDFIGSCETTVNRLLSKEDTTLPLINAKKMAKKGSKYKDSGTLIFNNTNLLRQHTFVEFVQGGTQLDFAVAIDFTASNGNVTSPSSLHYINPSQPNQYEIAIRAIIDICQHYSNSKRFDGFGFGAKLPTQRAVSSVFTLNFTHNPSVVGLSGVMQAYRDSLNKVSLYGPTNFAPVINEVAKKAAQIMRDGSRYQVLLIITDGVISDMAKTKQAIIAASTLPLSIIIVGVGMDDFESMDELDSDNQLLSHEGRVAQRDIVQFVPLRNFLNANISSPQESERAMGLLAKEVLAEVPAQLTGYMKVNNIHPRPSDNPFPVDKEEALSAPSMPSATIYNYPPSNQGTVYPTPSSQGYGTPSNVQYPPQQHPYNKEGYQRSSVPSNDYPTHSMPSVNGDPSLQYPNGHPPTQQPEYQGYSQAGYPPPGAQGCPQSGYPPSGAQGYPQSGYPPPGAYNAHAPPNEYSAPADPNQVHPSFPRDVYPPTVPHPYAQYPPTVSHHSAPPPYPQGTQYLDDSMRRMSVQPSVPPQ